MLARAFAIVADLTTMKVATGDVAVLHQQAKKLCAARGLAASTEVFASATAKMSADQFSRSSGIRKEAFASVAQADAWLGAL
ncbi:hypothetical protein OR16_21883 [Cupriavidus basilensis OR16]|uniref:Uncharacterized protein n=1 Tax=Cupriavidus basilensis OR16 TaxID=1127483 RepID=H1S8Q5_9BURK|nr:hypothetical protein [Cupriavidus basilensis]EHP41097.1 hypothetical protein OR16_21883 [Cupriavidus basilensis OR16]